RSGPGVGQPVEQRLQLGRHHVLLDDGLAAVHPKPVDEAIGPGRSRRGAAEALLDRRPLSRLELRERDAGAEREAAEAARTLDVELVLLARGALPQDAEAATGSCVAVSTPTCAQASATALASREVEPYSADAAISVACANVWNCASGGTARSVITWYQIRPA